MLQSPTTDPSQIAACRAVFSEMSSSWIAVASKSESNATARAEAQVFGQMVVALAEWLGPAARNAQSGPLQELRLLSNGITAHQGKLLADKSQTWWQEQSVTGLQAGDHIVMTATRFSKLCDACLLDVAS